MLTEGELTGLDCFVQSVLRKCMHGSTLYLLADGPDGIANMQTSSSITNIVALTFAKGNDAVMKQYSKYTLLY